MRKFRISNDMVDTGVIALTTNVELSTHLDDKTQKMLVMDIYQAMEVVRMGEEIKDIKRYLAELENAVAALTDEIVLDSRG